MEPQRFFVSVGTFATISLAMMIPAWGQTFSSGSTGADGALDLTSGSQTVQVPPSGIFNYTTVNIPAGQTLSFINNLTNTPVIMLAQGNVNIAGAVDLSTSGSTPGPGGFYGGDPNTPGWGPGGGQAEQSGTWMGPLSLFPNIGGGGGGGHYGAGCNSSGSTWGPSIEGGGGGGALTIASSGAIAISGTISATGGTNYAQTCFWEFHGTTGATGALRLVANLINVSGSVSASAFRMEAPTGSNSFTGSGTSPVIATINPQIVPTNPPSLQIVSVGGYTVPPNSGSSFSTIDLLLPNQLPDPIAVVVQATNVPPGSPVTINFSNSSSATFSPANLTGTTASSTATLYVSSLNRGSVVYLYVFTTFDASQVSKNINPFDPAAVSNIEVASVLGGRTRYRFLQRDGTEVSPSNLPFDLRLVYGL
jgi:hypothetical protein